MEYILDILGGLIFFVVIFFVGDYLGQVFQPKSQPGNYTGRAGRPVRHKPVDMRNNPLHGFDDFD